MPRPAEPSSLSGESLSCGEAPVPSVQTVGLRLNSFVSAPLFLPVFALRRLLRKLDIPSMANCAGNYANYIAPPVIFMDM